ncbi:MAG: ROK family transcriptional regulator [Chloroflexi bacterium]|nr:ROK family transcriptional regulator [Chloroflexota bacterium]
MNTKNTADQALVRELNLSSVFRYIVYNEGPVSRSHLAASIGLNKTTVSSLVQELIERGLIHETGTNSAWTGRPATRLEVNPEAGAIIGVELGVGIISVMVLDFVGNVGWRRLEEVDLGEDMNAAIHKTLLTVHEAMAVCRERNARILGLGLAVPGMVSRSDGVLAYAPHLEWRNAPLQEIFANSTGLPVFVENDANAAAVGEHLFGAARKMKDFIFIFAGIGLGGGLFLKGELYRGKNGYAGEIEHFPRVFTPYRTLIQRIQCELEAKRSKWMPGAAGEHIAPLSISLLKPVVESVDPEMAGIFRQAGEALGVGIAGLVNIFNPEQIILGGPLSVAGDLLLPAILESVKKYALPELSQRLDIVLSSFGPDATVIGAVALIIDHIIATPSIVERR